MKKFILEVIIFCLILFCVVTSIKAFVPYHWGNKFIGDKIKLLEESENEYDTYFLGSSLFYRHINPILFDKITKRNSFNLGCPGMYALETDFILDKLYKSNIIQSKDEVFINRIDLTKISDLNLHSNRTKYFMDWKRLRKGISYFAKKKEYKQCYNHLSAFIENKLAIGQIFPILNYKNGDHFDLDPTLIEQKGFYSFEDEIENTNSKSLLKRNQNFKAQIKKGKIKERISKPFKIDTLSNTKAYTLHSDKKLYLLKGNPVNRRPMYFDRAHLNKKGSEMFTTKLSRYYNKNKITSK